MSMELERAGPEWRPPKPHRFLHQEIPLYCQRASERMQTHALVQQCASRRSDCSTGSTDRDGTGTETCLRHEPHGSATLQRARVRPTRTRRAGVQAVVRCGQPWHEFPAPSRSHIEQWRSWAPGRGEVSGGRPREKDRLSPPVLARRGRSTGCTRPVRLSQLRVACRPGDGWT